ncbi:monoacylglycerol lipase ABHD6-like [Hemicordylus capensis]|uniref:monoacylglycerol lipase ABHD6-like n=1 Tax=Hemicordylus capensis TaxID=884348 RepID=UPI00230315FC|nr:monoacylglycerol lipase ABHD6-like [Hemicordylus capensis]
MYQTRISNATYGNSTSHPLIRSHSKSGHLVSLYVFRYKRLRCGMQVKQVDHEDFRFSYFCRGKPGPQPSILMLHGFSFSKNMWLNTIKFFPTNLHVVSLDMPGHGETTRLLGESYTAAAQVKRIHQFVERIGLNKKPFHLIGISIGGMVAGVYAAQYPSEVCSLSLLCPIGLTYPKDNEFFKRSTELLHLKEANDSILVSLTTKQEGDLLKLGLYHASFHNIQLLRGYLDDKRPHRMFFITCFLDIIKEESRHCLNNSTRKIRAPTQIIWGTEDKIFDPSEAEILARTIPNSQLHMLEECGHFITLDAPDKSAELLLEFYTSICDST